MKREELEKYLPYLDDDDATDEQKMMMLEALSQILEAFVSMAFNHDFDDELGLRAFLEEQVDL